MEIIIKDLVETEERTSEPEDKSGNISGLRKEKKLEVDIYGIVLYLWDSITFMGYPQVMPHVCVSSSLS